MSQANPIPTTLTLFAAANRPVWQLEGNFLSLDAVVTAHHSSEVQVTGHNVEQGMDVTDNIRPLPDELTLEGFISGVPIGAAFKGVKFPVGGSGRAKTAFDLLRAWKDAGAILDVTTRLNDYPNMVISHVDFPQDKETGDSLRFTVKLRTLRIVTSEVIAGIARNPSGGAVANKSTLAGTPVDNPQPFQSLGVKGKNALQSLFGGH